MLANEPNIYLLTFFLHVHEFVYCVVFPKTNCLIKIYLKFILKIQHRYSMEHQIKGDLLIVTIHEGIFTIKVPLLDTILKDFVFVIFQI